MKVGRKRSSLRIGVDAARVYGIDSATKRPRLAPGPLACLSGQRALTPQLLISRIEFSVQLAAMSACDGLSLSYDTFQ